MLDYDVFDLLIYNTIFQKSILEKLFTNANMKIVLLLLGSWKRIFILFLLAMYMHIFILKQEQTEVRIK